MAEITCHVCDDTADEAPDGKLFTCSKCKAVSYCSKECQKEDWKEHKRICGQLSYGDAKQPIHSDHARTAELLRHMVDLACSDDSPDFRRMMSLFIESKTEVDHTETKQKMKRIFMKQTKYGKKVFLFRCLGPLCYMKRSHLRLETSPLLLVLKYVDASVLSGPDGDPTGSTALHWVAEMKDPAKKITHKNQVFLARQLLDHGANVNARAGREHMRCTPLFRATHSNVSTNLDLIKLLLDNGADPNAANDLGETPLMCTLGASPGAAKFLLEYSERTDPNRVTKDGRRMLPMVSSVIDDVRYKASIPNNPNAESLRFNLQLLVELEKLLVKKGAL